MKSTAKRIVSILLTVCLLLGLVTVPAMAEESVVITKQPEDVKVAFGETATFTVEAEGKNLNYSWYNWWGYPMDDEAFTGENTNTLKVKADCSMNGIIFNCEIYDGGEEYVYSKPVEMKVTGHAEAEHYAFDEKSHMAYCDCCREFYALDAHVFGDDAVCDVCAYTEGGEVHPPIILQEANYNYVEFGEDMRFIVKAYGIGLRYQWYRFVESSDEEPLKLTDGEKYTGTTTRILTVKAAECADDDYVYRCIVSNTAGNNITQTRCHVIENYDVKQEDAFTHKYYCRECDAFGGSDRHFDTDCDAKCDECGFVFPANAPKLTSQPEDHFDVKNGHAPITYKVTATGNNLTYQWYAEGDALEDDDKFSGTDTATLTVKSIYDEETDTYDCAHYYYGFYCVVSNENGMVCSQSGAYDIEDAGIADFSYLNEFYHEVYCECGNWIEDVPHEDADHNKVCDDCGYKYEDPFKDVTDGKAWYYDAARYGKDEGFFKGDNGNFKPESNITRGEMVTVLARIGYTQDYIDSMSDYAFEEFLADLSLKYGTTSVEFTDIEGKFYERHARILSALGVVNGYANNLFKGEANITREELATILVRFLGIYGALGRQYDEPVDSFKDADKVSDWAVEYVEAVREMGIFKGDNGNFKPRSNALRSEVAQTMFRMGCYEGMLLYLGN
ncbi:MAG: S-layer homology domain-containing protein [Clostridia bacterium]|nr:S-layer homology domain-containing protein [Clostridia bacterium]